MDKVEVIIHRPGTAGAKTDTYDNANQLDIDPLGHLRVGRYNGGFEVVAVYAPDKWNFARVVAD
jgi:hypothetical protein